jgi:hypothetical protein
VVKTRYFEASDGSIQPLPDNINQLFDTDFNEFERLEKEYIASYNQPEPEVSPLETDFIDDEDIERSSLFDIARSSFSREFVQTPAQKELYEVAPEYANATQELQNLLELPDLNTEQKDRVEVLRKKIEGEDKTAEEILQDVTRETRFTTRDPSFNFIKDQVEERQGLEKTVQQKVDIINQSQKFQDQIVYSDSFNQLAEAESVGEAFETFKSDPFNLIGQVTATSLAPMSKSLAAGVLTTAVLGPLAGAAATGITSGSVDAAHSFTEYMVKKGMNPSDPESVARYMSDTELVSEAEKYARTRGAIIGSFDGLSFGFATKLMAPKAISNIFARQAMNSLVTQPAIQGTLGGSGEYFAQLATLEEGEEIRVGDVAMEIIGEFGFAPAEAAFGQVAAGRQYSQEAQNLKAEEQLRITKDFYNTLQRGQVEGAPQNDLIKLINLVELKTTNNINAGQNPIEARANAINEVNERSELVEALNIYSNYTNKGQNPEQFPSKIVTPDVTVPNIFLTKQLADGTFTIVDYQGNSISNPNTNETYSYPSLEVAGKVVASLNLLSQTQYGVEKTNDYIEMQNLDPANPFISNLGQAFSNPFYDGISVQELESIGVAPDVIKTITDATGNKLQVPINVLKDNLSKKQFDKIMTTRSESGILGETLSPKSITEATFKKLFKDKNVEFDVNSDAFKQLALQYTAETDINKMSIAQKRVLYSVINRLPSSPELISLPDFSNRSYSLNDYNKALQAIIETSKPTLKTIREATGLNGVAAKRLRQDFITAGYVEEKNGKFKFKGTGNKKFTDEGVLVDEETLEVNQDLDNLIESFRKNLPPEVGIKFEKYIRDQQGNINRDAEGAFNPVFNEIIVAIDRAGLDFKNNPEQSLDDLARVLGHESWHSLRQADVFTEAEYNTLVNYVRNTKPKNSDKTYYELALEEYGGRPEYDNEADIVEEGIAKVYEDYIENKKNVTGRPASILNKVNNFFTRTVNALNENGFQTANDIVERSLSGKLADRETGKVRTTLELDRIRTKFNEINDSAINLGFDINNQDDAPLSERPIEDAPTLKYKFREDLLTNPPRIYTEYIMGVEDNQFTEDMSAWVNLMYQNPNVLNEYLIKRRFPTADRNGLREISQTAYQATQDILRDEAGSKNNGKKVFYFVGDIPTGDTVAVAYDNQAEAVRSARLGDSQYHSLSGNPNQIRIVELDFSDVLFHPNLINVTNRPTIANPYKKKGLFGVSATALKTKAGESIPVKPAIGQSTTKLSLVRTEGRITPQKEIELVTQPKFVSADGRTVRRIEWDSLPDKYNDEEEGTLISRVVEEAQNEGSDSIAAVLENDENYFIKTLGVDQWRSSDVERLQEDIQFITEEALSNFPEQIVVYRGSSIKDEYDLVPVTFDRRVAETFSPKDTGDFVFGDPEIDALEEVKDGIIAEDGSVIEYIIPKDKVLAYINPIMTGGYDFDVTGSLGKQYKFFNEGELLVNKKDLIELGRPIERLGPRFKQQLYNRVKTAKEQAKSILNQNSIDFLLGGPVFTTELASDDVYNLLVRQLGTKLKKLSNRRLNRDELIKLLTDSALVEAENRVFAQEETAKMVKGEIKSDKYFDDELKARKDKYLPQLIKKAESYAEGVVKADRKAVIAIGLPASGKSHFAEKIAKKIGASIVDSDDAKKILPEYGDGLGANAVAVESSSLFKDVLESQIELGNNIVIPKVGGTSKMKSIISTIDNLRNNYGYDVDVILVDADFNNSITRVLNRFVETGRYIPSSYLIDVENTPRDTYNNLKDEYGDLVNFVFVNNNFGVGEQTLEEDTSGSYQYLAKRRSVGVGNDEITIQQEQEQGSETKRLLEKAKAEKQKSIEAGVRPVINTGANPDAVAAAVKAQEDIKNTPSAESADINFIFSDIGQENKIKYSFKNSGKPLKTETERIVKRLTVRDNTPDDVTVGQRVLETLKGFWNPLGFRQEILDQYARLADTDYVAGEISGVGDEMLSASVSAAAALYHSDRSGDIFQQSFLRGVPVYNKEKGYTTVVDVSPQDGQPIVAPYEIFKEAINNPNMLWAFQAVLRVQRETRFDAEGRKVKITAQDKKDAEQALKDYPQLQTMIDQYQTWNSHIVRFLIDTGVLDEKTGKIWMETSDYIPFYRPLEGMEGFKGPKILQGLSITPFKRAKGSEEKDIVDPITGITNNLRAAINLGMKNVAANRVMRNLQILGVAEQVKGNVKGPNIVQIKVNGKTTSWKVDDPDYFNAFTIMTGGDFALTGLLMGALRGTKQIVSDFITRLPDFWFRQILRDSVSAWTLSGANYTPVISSLKETVSIAVGLATGNLPKEFKQLRDSGIITGYDQGVRQIDTTEKLVNNLYKKEVKKQRSTVKKIMMAPFDTLAKVWEILGQGTAITDAATRVAVYKDALKRTGNEAEAIFQAMEVLNFTRRGNHPFFQFLAQTTMFLNPRIQGLDVFYRGLTGKYGIGRGLSPAKRLKSVFLRFAGLISLVPYYYLLVRDSEEYEEAPEEIKDNYIIIPGTKKLTGETIALPKPFEVGLLAFTIPERLIAYTMDDIAGKDVTDSLKRNISTTLSITPPTLVEPLIENYFNYDFFTGRKIVPSYLEGTDDLAYRPSTDTLSKVVGDELNISPLYVENLIRGYSGSMGTYVMQGVDSMLREGLTGSERASLRVDQLPVVGAFTLPPEGRGIENQFYDLKGMTDDLVQSFRKLEDDVMDRGDTFAIGMAKEYRVEYYDALKDLQSQLQETADLLKEARNLEAITINDPNLSPDEKRDKLVEIQDAKNEILKAEQIPELRKFFIEDFKPQAVQR